MHTISEITNTLKDDYIGVLIINDNLSKKNSYTKHIEDLDF
ncbi:hypothetical protein CLO_2645 [Clostridium botulinum E1 str. 'BoNT E Beluga']|uniref:Uncharacterized protein n=2 Tax=Clostridium TaxID=1485 RepID=C4IHL4_CLOBU|nr:hypothetical protein CLH_1116 [Clostridium botulinum E3 str. Alaska E43]ALT05360.1 IS4 transposase [Clostridium botulinum]EDT74800.1 hypothetical protein CBY_2625 [Clostridium butyricum 5521]EEP54818.1 hypothetical protein CLP_2745 [Clostridium butyricum E4 str. BoNT E BL5262]EES48031.1 hypothetical protein CLO_2645 [Clostridium botulinum E1 str. 'BoNT E Beluga']